MVKLKYIGKMTDVEIPNLDLRLWNIFNSPRPDLHPDGSSISVASLKEMGII